MLQNIVVFLSGLEVFRPINWPQKTVLLFCLNSTLDNKGQKTSCPKEISIIPSFFLSLTEVYQDKTRIFLINKLFYLSVQDVMTNCLHLAAFLTIVEV